MGQNGYFSVNLKGPFQKENGGFRNLLLGGHYLSSVSTLAHLFKKIKTPYKQILLTKVTYQTTSFPL